MLSLLFKRTVAANLLVAKRSIQTSVVKRSADPLIGHVDQQGQPGKNLPFNIGNKYKLAIMFILYFGSAFSAPYLIVRYQLLKNKS